jgi:hypothetical protein
MGRQFQLETIPRFQWRVIVEVRSGLAQTKLDSTNFWVIECDVRFGVKSAVLTVGQSLPIYPEKRTSSRPVGMSQMCQEPTKSNIDFEPPASAPISNCAQVAERCGLRHAEGQARRFTPAGFSVSEVHGKSNKRVRYPADRNQSLAEYPRRTARAAAPCRRLVRTASARPLR